MNKSDPSQNNSNLDDANSDDEGPVSSFQSYAAEGDILAKQGDYRKAIDAYSKVLGQSLYISVMIQQSVIIQQSRIIQQSIIQ